jgi:hypothetical protein
MGVWRGEILNKSGNMHFFLPMVCKNQILPVTLQAQKNGRYPFFTLLNKKNNKRCYNRKKQDSEGLRRAV